MLTQMNWGEGEQVECVFIISIFKNLVLKILEEIRDSRQTRNEILTELGRIGKFLRNYSHWEVSVFQKRMIKGQGNQLLTSFLHRGLPGHFERLPNNPEFYSVKSALLF